MGNAYVVGTDGRTDVMERIRCTNEDRELQLILENNPDLLPGEQITPDNPRRWLLIKREMPVPDPSTGTDRWSVDLLFADQDAIPTFVECKRYADTRSRREVIGQMFEYAANGHYYWSVDALRSFATAAGNRINSNLDEAIRLLQPTDELSTDAFFERLHNNLREGQVRLIFFMEESPTELRSVVDFLNRQLERSEILIVEARQYEREGLRVVVPVLFGYTEEARKAKRSVTVDTSATRKQWDRTSFIDDASSKPGSSHSQQLEEIHDQCLELGYEIVWGKGRQMGTFGVKAPSVCARSLITVYSDGSLAVNFGGINGTEEAEQFRDRLKELLIEKAGLAMPDDYSKKYPSFSASQWIGKSKVLIDILAQLRS